MNTSTKNSLSNIHVNIRTMDISDLDQVLEIDNLSFTSPWPKNAYLYELNENPKSKLWVAEINLDSIERIVIGMIVIWIILDEIHIATLAVHPGYRKQGVAKKLITMAINEAKNQGAKEITLEVRKSNIAAQELYRLFDFHIVGHRKGYYQNNREDALIMTRNNIDIQPLLPQKLLKQEISN